MLIALAALWVVGGALIVVWVGLGIPAGVCARGGGRKRAPGDGGGKHAPQPVPVPYLPVPPGPRHLRRIPGGGRRSDDRRDLAWSSSRPSSGLVVSVVLLVLLVGVVTTDLVVRDPAADDGAGVLRLVLLATAAPEKLEQRVQTLAASRADLVDHSAAELRRLERDLHDGAPR